MKSILFFLCLVLMVLCSISCIKSKKVEVVEEETSRLCANGYCATVVKYYDEDTCTTCFVLLSNKKGGISCLESLGVAE